ncbi:MAG: HAD family hydrolase [Myxococcales bacterium]|nr:HAD family hydrolase [Myxococcales bacterium]
MRFDCVLLDFDGTFTLAEEEGAPFVEAYRADLAQRLGRDVAADWDECEATVRARPTEYGWLFQGKLVAPGNADPYIRSTTVARMLFDRFDAYLDPTEREGALSDLYFKSYERSATVFRPGAKRVLEILLASGVPLYVVTNSGTDAVTRKVEQLLPDAARRPIVRGNAKKAFIEPPSEVDGAFAGLPERQSLEGLERPVYLRRGRYYEVLRDIWQETHTRPERTLFVGDIYELDLAMPFHLGVAIHLIASEVTPDYERRFVAREQQGGLSETLDAVLERVGL